MSSLLDCWWCGERFKRLVPVGSIRWTGPTDYDATDEDLVPAGEGWSVVPDGSGESVNLKPGAPIHHGCFREARDQLSEEGHVRPPQFEPQQATLGGFGGDDR